MRLINKDADLKFREIMKLFRVAPLWIIVRFYSVRVGGYLFQFKNWLKGQKQPILNDKKNNLNSKYTIGDKIVDYILIIFILLLILLIFKNIIKWIF